MQIAAQNRAEEEAYAAQTDAITRMRGILEEEANEKRGAMQKAIQEENRRLALEKKRREEAWKKNQLDENSKEIKPTEHHEVLDATGRITRIDQ